MLGTLSTAGFVFLQAETPAAPEKKAVQHSIVSKGQQQPDGQDEGQSAKATEAHSSATQENLKIQRELANYTYWLAAATILLVVVGILQFILLIRQEGILHGALKEIHAQAEQMEIQTGVLERSVAAAEKNANSLINAERGWVLAELSWFDDGAKRMEEKIYSTIGTNDVKCAVAWIKLTCRNEGRSPVWIDNVYARMDCIVRSEARVFNRLECGNFGPIAPIGAGANVYRGLDLESGNAINEGGFLSIYVIIAYHDIFGAERETTIGYSIDLAGDLLRQSGLPVVFRNT